MARKERAGKHPVMASTSFALQDLTSSMHVLAALRRNNGLSLRPSLSRCDSDMTAAVAISHYRAAALDHQFAFVADSLHHKPKRDLRSQRAPRQWTISYCALQFQA